MAKRSQRSKHRENYSAQENVHALFPGRSWSPHDRDQENRDRRYVKNVRAMSPTQQQLMDAIDAQNVVLALGPAGYAGAAVWSGVPTVDRKRKRLYVTTGNNYVMPNGVSAAPAGDHVESVLALDMTTGAILWSHAMTTEDVWTFTNEAGGDFDMGCGANLFQASVGGVTKDLVGAGQKSGLYWVLDAETGTLVWKTQTGPGGHLGGIQWGTAVDGSHVYFGVNDTDGSMYALAGKGSQAGQMVGVGSWGALDPTSGDVLWQIANPAMTRPTGARASTGRSRWWAA